MSSTDPTSLTNTLILALTQCQEQLHTLQRQAVRIDRLQQENQRLRKELEDARSSEATRVEPQPTIDAQDLFQRNIDAQAEIHRLNGKLKAYKEKAKGRLSVPLSSPLPSSSAPAPVPAEVLVFNAPDPPCTKRAASERSPSPPAAVPKSLPSSPPRKRQRANSREGRGALAEVPVNVLHSRTPSSSASKRSIAGKKVAAIPFIAEDGDDHISTDTTPQAQPKPNGRENSASRRLDDLLADPNPVKSPLLRSNAGAGRTRTVGAGSRSNEARPSGISNISHALTSPGEDTNAAVRAQSRFEGSTSTMRESANVNLDEALRARPSLRTGGTSTPRTRAMKGPEDEEPLRARPLQRLSLHHFKPNPGWLDSQGVSYDDFLHGLQGERIKALAETLPHLPGASTHEKQMTDHELLLDLLGPGSEERIANLTQSARSNLLLEARTKRIAQAFARQRQDYDREQDAPGFWMADMPGTQEDEENRAVAKQRERNEVQRRYDDAVRGGGRWVFADE